MTFYNGAYARCYLAYLPARMSYLDLAYPHFAPGAPVAKT
jgi:hypothetical protein